MLTVSTVNVNGMRAAAKKGFVEWLAATKADVVACQEVRAETELLPDEVRAPAGWHAFHAPCELKGRAGVSLYSRAEPESVRIGFDAPEFAESGRYLEATFAEVVVASLYLLSGDVGTPRQAEKERFMAAFLPYLAELRGKAEADGREVLVVGDWNIAHAEVDLKNWHLAPQRARQRVPAPAVAERVHEEQAAARFGREVVVGLARDRTVVTGVAHRAHQA